MSNIKEIYHTCTKLISFVGFENPVIMLSIDGTTCNYETSILSRISSYIFNSFWNYFLLICSCKVLIREQVTLNARSPTLHLRSLGLANQSAPLLKWSYDLHSTSKPQTKYDIFSCEFTINIGFRAILYYGFRAILPRKNPGPYRLFKRGTIPHS